MPMGIPMLPLSPQVLLPSQEWRVGPQYKSLYRNMMLARKRNARNRPWIKRLRKFPGVTRRRSMFGKIDFDDEDDVRHKVFYRNIMRRYSQENIFQNPLFNYHRRRIMAPKFKRQFRNSRLKRPTTEGLDSVFDFNKRNYMKANGPFNKQFNVKRRLRTKALHQRQMIPRFKDDFIEDYSDSFDDRPFDTDYDNVYHTFDRGLRRFGPVSYGDEHDSRVNGYEQSLARAVQSTTAQQFQNQGMTRNQRKHLAHNSAANGLREGRGVHLNIAQARPQVNGKDQGSHKLDSWDPNSILPTGMNPHIDTERSQHIHVGDMFRPAGKHLTSPVVSKPSTDVALRNTAITDIQRSVDNEWKGDAQLPTDFGQTMIDNFDRSNQQLTQQSQQTVAENNAFTFVNNQLKQPAPDRLQVFPVNPYANDHSEVLLSMDDSRDLEQATFALLGIEPSSVDLKPMDQGMQNVPTLRKDEPPVKTNSWSKSEMSAFLPVSQNNELLSAHLIQEQGENTKTDDPLVNKNVQTEKRFRPNVKTIKLNGDESILPDDPPAIHIPVNGNTLVKEQTLSNMINMPQDMFRSDKVPPLQLGNENSKMSTTNDHSVTNGGLTANTFKDSFVNLDHLDFGFDNF